MTKNELKAKIEGIKNAAKKLVEESEGVTTAVTAGAFESVEIEKILDDSFDFGFVNKNGVKRGNVFIEKSGGEIEIVIFLAGEWTSPQKLDDFCADLEEWEEPA